jgi:hypothetical protein
MPSIIKTRIPLYTVFLCSSCDRWWNVNDTAESQAPFSKMSTSPFLSEQWNHCDKSEAQSLSSGGGFTCMLFTHRRHLILYKENFFI